MVFLILVALFLWDSPVAEGLTDVGWHLLVIFVLTIIAIILKLLPMGAVALTCIAILSLTKTVPINVCLSSYAKPIVWMVVFAFFIARGFSLTGLGSRLAYFFMGIFGKSTLGMSYGFAITDLVLAPAVPSNTARGAGIVFPVINSLSEELESRSRSEGNNLKIGGFLTKVAFQSNLITSTMFLTAMAGNPLVANFAKDIGVRITWVDWMLAALVPGVISLLLMPLIVYKIYPPGIKNIPDAQSMAKKRLSEMGSMNSKQIIMLFTFILILILWVFGDTLGIPSSLAALTGIVILLLTEVLKWEDLLKERAAWNTLVWFSILLMLAQQLQSYGVIDWFGELISEYIVSYDKIVAYTLVSVLYFYVHYFFASSTALVSSMYQVFLLVMINSGVDHFSAAMSLAVFSSLSACLTHYGTGTAPVYFGARHVSMSDWWRIGAVLSIFYLLIWGIIGNIWWSFLGFCNS